MRNVPATRPRRRFAAGMIAMAALAFAPAAPAQHAAVTVTALSADAVVIRGRVANLLAVRTGAGLVVVDALISPLHARLARAQLATIFPGEPVRYLIVTHYHPDHQFGAQEFPEALMIAHRQTVARAPGTQSAADEYLRAAEELQRLRERLQSGEPAAALAPEFERWQTRLARYAGFRLRAADLALDDGVTLRLGGKTIEISHPGAAHTDGDLLVRFVEDGIVATGDLVFNRIVPVFDLDGGVDLPGWIAALRAQADAPAAPRHVVPGHGDAGGPGLLTEQADYLQDLLDAVTAARRDGQALADAQASIRLPRYADYEPMFGDLAGNIEACWRWLDARNQGSPAELP